MKTITQHIPDFVEGVEPQIVHFETKEELLDIPFVKKYFQDIKCLEDYSSLEEVNSLIIATVTVKFYRMSLSKDISPSSKGGYLMAEYEDGLEWWTVGYIDDITGIDLPNWSAKTNEGGEK
jgi:hypothetical protein